MPAYDLRHIQAAKYTKSDSGNTVTYSDVTKVGDAMTANFELRNAEGRLYAESSLAEYMRKATGGTISLGVKYITEAAQVLLYKAVKTTRSVKTKSISVVRYGKTSTSQYVGVSFYAPDMIDGVEKFTCIFIGRALFGPPSHVYQTLGENITFNTPVTSGEFLVDALDNLVEIATCDSEEDARAYCDAVLGKTA
jgi:hypothetical protein